MARVWLGQLLLLRPLPGRSSVALPAVGIDIAEAARIAGTLQAEDVRAEAEEAIRHLSQVSGLRAGGAEGETAVAALLGCALLVRGATGLPDGDLDRAIDCFAHVVGNVDPDDHGVREIIAVHGWLLAERARRPGHMADVTPAADRLAQTAELLPAGHVLRPAILYYLGMMLGLRGVHRLHPPDLAAGIAALTEALGQMPEGHPLRGEILGMLGAALVSSVQFDLPGLPVDKVIAILAEARSIPQPDPARRAAYLYSYGCALHIRAVRDGAREDYRAAADMLKEAAGLVPKEHRLYSSMLFALAGMLADQYSYLGNLEALDAAAFYLDTLIPVVESAGGPAYHVEGVNLCFARAVRGGVQLQRGWRHEDPAALDSAVADLRFALDNLPPQSPWRGRLTSELGQAQLGRAVLAKDMTTLLAALPTIIEAAEGAPAGHPDRGMLAGRAGVICTAQGWLTRDRGLLDRGVRLLSAAVTDTGMSPDEQTRLRWGLGFGLVHRYGITRNRTDLDRGIEQLEEAQRGFTRLPGDPAMPQVLALLAESYHQRGDSRRGDPRRAAETGIAALREQAGDVLLQTGTQRGLITARISAAEATEVAGWSLEAGDPDAAVEALELGRGQVLHAATVATGVPAVLSATGHGELAREWEAARADSGGPASQQPWDTGEAAQPGVGWQHDRAAQTRDALLGELPGVAIPSDLRHRVLTALAGSALDRMLLTPPGRREITAAMRATGTDAVVYLVPAGENAGGRALVLTPKGITAIPLPGLKANPRGRVAAYAQAHDDVFKASDLGHDDPRAQRAQRRWNHALGDLCDWAWDAAMQSVFDAIGTYCAKPLPRITLIPFGILGMVPWHAARSRTGAGQAHYACEQAVFSYAASGRQFMATAGRGLLPGQASAVFVGEPVARNIWANWEAKYIRDAYYRDGRYLGARPPDEATVDQVLGWLPSENFPGASLLHLSCHARTGRSPDASHLRLSGDQPLAVDRILRQAQFRRPGLPGGLVVLSACVSDLSMADYDEALTLATAFAAAGAASVVGTRWLVPDVRTALLMFMFHHHLTAGLPPSDALRLAQLWMLGPDRAIPVEMPAMLADEVPRKDLGNLAAWAGFIHMGR
jgi:hypothetical protein